MPLVAKTLRMGIGNSGKRPNPSDSDPRLQFQRLGLNTLGGQRGADVSRSASKRADTPGNPA